MLLILWKTPCWTQEHLKQLSPPLILILILPLISRSLAYMPVWSIFMSELTIFLYRELF